MAVGAVWPAVCDREPAGCGDQPRHRGGDQCGTRWSYRLGGVVAARGQRNALREAPFQFHARYRSGRRDHARVQCDGRCPGISGRLGAGIHQLRQGQPGQAQFRVVGNGGVQPYRRRVVQDHDRDRYGARAIPQFRTGADRSLRRSGPGNVRLDHLHHRAHQGGPAAPAGGDLGAALGSACGHAGDERFRARLRIEQLVRARHAEPYARGDRRHAQ